MKSDQPMVSIYCATYNHEKYIRDCLEGFLMQKTDFPFEVIVHDDASTDGTQNIIREYEEKYPNIIRPIYQKENQLSLGVQIAPTYIFPMVRGKYIAICEGDDYWTDDEKLQRQVEIMEKHPECHLCVCGVEEVSLNKTPLGYNRPNMQIDDEFIEPEAFIQYASRCSFQTSSYFMRYTDWSEYIINPPAYRKISAVGDVPILLYFGSMGKTAYINRIMSCYRRGGSSSFSIRKLGWSDEKIMRYFKSLMELWRLFDDYTEKRYHSTCVKKGSKYMFGYYILKRQANELIRRKNREYFAVYPFHNKIYIILSCCFKNTMKKLYIWIMRKKQEEQRRRWENL